MIFKKFGMIATLLFAFLGATATWADGASDLFFQGTLGGKPIWINVSADTAASESGQELGSTLYGVYGYGLYDGRDINISGKINEDGTFTVYETDEHDKKTAFWDVRIDLSEGTLKGNWHNAAKTKTLPIDTRLTAMSETIRIQQAVPKNPDAGSSSFKSIASSLTLPYLLDPTYQSLNSTINKRMLDFAQGVLKDKSGFSSSTDSVRALTPSTVVMVNDTYGYGLGAAHGGSNSSHIIYTRANAQQPWHKLTFADIQAGNSQQCLPLLRQKMIAALHKVGASRPDDLTVKDIPDLDFMPTAQGVRFYFGEYAVGSYVEGTYQIFLNYQQTDGCLRKPDNFSAQ